VIWPVNGPRAQSGGCPVFQKWLSPARAGDGNRNRMTSLEVRSPACGLTCVDDGPGQGRGSVRDDRC
jgi:hypothetical protein